MEYSYFAVLLRVKPFKLFWFQLRNLTLEIRTSTAGGTPHSLKWSWPDKFGRPCFMAAPVNFSINANLNMAGLVMAFPLVLWVVFLI